MCRTLVLLVIALSGCGGELFDTRYDEIAPSGLRVRYANERPPRIDAIDAIYSEVVSCIGIHPAPKGPLIVIEQGLFAQIGHEGVWLPPDIIRIDDTITMYDPAAMPRFIFKHEMVHYLLSAIGFPHDRNISHDSQFFQSCGN